MDQVQQRCCALFRAVWAKLGSKRLLWERMRALFYDYRLDSMRELLAALWYGLQKSQPIVAVDSSSFPSMRLRPHSIAPGDTPSFWESYASMTRGGLLSTRQPVISDRESDFKRRNPMVETLKELSATMVI